MFLERDDGRDEEEELPPPLPLRCEEATRDGLVLTSSRLSRGLGFMRGGVGGGAALGDADDRGVLLRRDRCFILDGLMTFSRVIGDDDDVLLMIDLFLP